MKWSVAQKLLFSDIFLQIDKEALDFEECKTHVFRARPVPKSTFTPTIAVSPRKKGALRTPAATRPNTTSTKSAIRPPKLATSARVGRREAATEASRKNAATLVKEKIRMAARRQRELHSEEVAKSIACAPARKMTSPKPFQLHSVARHHAHVSSMEQERLHREEDEERMRHFRAKPIDLSFPKPPAVQTPRPLTEFRPFKLTSESRHESAQRQITAHLEEEEARAREATQFRANRLPKSHFNAFRLTSPTKEEGGLTAPCSPEMALKRRAKDRAQYNIVAEKERREDNRLKKIVEARIKADEDLELYEMRRLPVEEGGLIPMATSINASSQFMGNDDN